MACDVQRPQKVVFFAVQADQLVQDLLFDRVEINLLQPFRVGFGDIHIEFIQFLNVASHRRSTDRNSDLVALVRFLDIFRMPGCAGS